MRKIGILIIGVILIVTVFSGCVNPENSENPTENPVLSFSSQSASFNINMGQTALTTFKIWNSGTGTLTYSLSESATWLAVSPISGTSTGEEDTITISVDSDELNVGTYTSDITITSNDKTKKYTVTVVVNTIPTYPEMLVIPCYPTIYHFPEVSPGTYAVQTTFEVRNVGTGTLHYSVTENYQDTPDDRFWFVTLADTPLTLGAGKSQIHEVTVFIEQMDDWAAYTGHILIYSTEGTDKHQLYEFIIENPN